jgi:ATP-dependent Lon protease
VSSSLTNELRRKIAIEPDQAIHRFQLGESLFADGDYQAAVKQLEKALELEPGHDRARRLLARAYEVSGKVGDAVRTLEELLRRRPDDVAVRDDLVGLLLAIGRFDDALLNAEEAAKAAPHDPRRWLTIGELYQKKRLYDPARAALERAQRLAPEDREIAAALKELYLEIGDEAAYDRVAGERGRDYFLAQAKRALASEAVRATVEKSGLGEAASAIARGELAAAKRALVGAAESARESAAFELLRGELFLIEGDRARAEKSFHACVSRDGQLGVAWNRLGDLAQARGELREAIGLYKKAILFAPDDANAYEDLGDIYATLGERAMADKMYAAATARDPGGKASGKRASLGDGATLDPEEASASVPAVGKIGVLGWTPTGGGVSPLEAVAVVGKGELIFSGNVGPSGREAGLVALSCLKTRADELKIAELVVSHDLHLHFTDTEFGKDGPSAGLALVLAGVSAYTRRPLKARLGATGEITIHGEVKPVGGIHEKLVAAHLAGIKTVLLPKRNLREGRDLPAELTARVEVIYVGTVAEAIEKALLPGAG